jgi:hypothetical protein
LYLAEAVSHGALDHRCSKLDLLLFRQAGGLAQSFDQRLFLGLGRGQLLNILVGLLSIGNRRPQLNPSP